MKKYGYKIREIREKNKDTREVLAKKLGVSLSALGKYERGERAVKPDLLEKVAKTYDISLSELLGEEGDIPNELKKYGVEWVSFIDEMTEKNFTPDEIKTLVSIFEKSNAINKK